MDATIRANPMTASQASTLPHPFSGQPGQEPSLAIEATPDMRRGSYADVVTAHTNGGNTMLDFLLIDSADASGGASGILTSRVIMSNESVIALRDMLNDLTRDWRSLTA